MQTLKNQDLALSTARAHEDDEIQLFIAETPAETPIKAMISPDQQIKFNEDAPAVASGAYALSQQPDPTSAAATPEYDFEAMLDAAMEAEGE